SAPGRRAIRFEPARAGCLRAFESFLWLAPRGDQTESRISVSAGESSSQCVNRASTTRATRHTNVRRGARLRETDRTGAQAQVFRVRPESIELPADARDAGVDSEACASKWAR